MATLLIVAIVRAMSSRLALRKNPSVLFVLIHDTSMGALRKHCSLFNNKMDSL